MTKVSDSPLEALRRGEAPDAEILSQVRLWTSAQLAQYLGISEVGFGNRVRKGYIPATFLDGRYYFTREQVNQAIHYHKMHETPAQAEARKGRRTLGEPIQFELIGEQVKQ